MHMDFAWTNRAEKLLVVAYWWEQQHGLCCLCGKLMEPYHRDAGKNPEAASVEHLVPRRENGPNTVGNVRLAHRRCNNVAGSLWAENQHRLNLGEPPLTVEEALERPKKIKPKYDPIPLFNEHSHYPKESAYYLRWIKWKAEQAAKGVSWNAGSALSLPRGATLRPDFRESPVAVRRLGRPTPTRS